MTSQDLNVGKTADRSQIKQTPPVHQKKYSAMEIALWMKEQERFISAHDIHCVFGITRAKSGSIMANISSGSKYFCAKKDSPMRLYVVHIDDGVTPIPVNVRCVQFLADPLYRLILTGTQEIRRNMKSI